jgi:hypothetical protein
MCQRAVWLERGTVRAIGPTPDVIRAYLDALDDAGESAAGADPYIAFDRTEVLDDQGRPAETLAPDRPFTVRACGRALQDLLEPVFVVTIRGDYGPLFAGNMHIDGNWPERIPAGPFTVECAFGPPCLRPATYRVELKVKQNVRTNYYEPRVLARFAVGAAADPLLGGAHVPHRWRPLDQAAPSLAASVPAPTGGLGGGAPPRRPSPFPGEGG